MANSKNSTKTILAVVAVLGIVLLGCCGVGAFLIRGAYQQFAGTAELPDGVTYSQWRKSFRSQLNKRGPAPQDYGAEVIPPNVTQVTYPSDDRNDFRHWL